MRRTSSRPARLRPPHLAWAVALAFLAAPAHAAAPIQLAETGAFVDVAVADDPAGGYLLVWGDAASSRLRARRVAPAGFPGPFLPDLPAVPSGLQDLAAAYSEAGGWIVLWTQPSGADQVGIGGAVFDAEDRLVRLLELPDPIPDPGGLVISAGPRVAALPGGGFALAFTVGIQEDPLEDPLVSTESDVYLLRLDDGGLQVGPAVRVDEGTTGFQVARGLGVSEAGIVVTFTSWSGDPEDDRDLLARIQGLDLSPVSAEIPVNELPVPPTLAPRSGLAVGPDGRFVVVWEGAGDAGGPEVRLRAFTAVGEPAGGEAPVAPPGVRQIFPDADLAGDGVVWVSWVDVVPSLGPERPPLLDIRARAHGLDGEPVEPAVTVATTSGNAPELTAGERGALLTWRPARESPVLVGRVVGLPPDVGTPPPELALESPELPGFRVWVRIAHGGFAFLWGTEARPCLAEALCAAGALPDRAEVIVRVVGPKPNGFLWPTIVKLSTSRVEVWIEQLATGDVQYYLLPGASPGSGVLPGLFDRHGFEP